jgi:hypothetical protein
VLPIPYENPESDIDDKLQITDTKLEIDRNKLEFVESEMEIPSKESLSFSFDDFDDGDTSTADPFCEEFSAETLTTPGCKRKNIHLNSKRLFIYIYIYIFN